MYCKKCGEYSGKYPLCNKCYYDEDEDFEDEEDEELEDEDLYQLVCPTCEEEIIIDEDVLAKGSMKCPACGEDLEFDLTELVDEVEDEE